MYVVRESGPECDGGIAKLERKIEELTSLDSGRKEHIAFCYDLLQNVPKYFVAADLPARQQIRGSILSEKLVFGETSYRTTKFRNIVSLLCRPGKDCREGKKKDGH